MKQRKANRLKGYDYSQDNLYFVTSCVQDIICCFGEIVVGTGRDLSLHPSYYSIRPFFLNLRLFVGVFRYPYFMRPEISGQFLLLTINFTILKISHRKEKSF